MAVLAAFGVLAGSVQAESVEGRTDDWYLVKLGQEGSSHEDQYAIGQVWAGDKVPAQAIEKTFTKTQLSAIREQKDFEGFLKSPEGLDRWSAVMGVRVGTEDESQMASGSWSNAAISVDTETFTLEDGGFDLVGAYHSGGHVKFDGTSTRIAATQRVQGNPDLTEDGAAIAYMLEATYLSPGQSIPPRSVNFAADSTELFARTTTQNGSAAGVYAVLNAEDGPSVIFSGKNVNISAVSDQADASAIWMGAENDITQELGTITFEEGTSSRLSATGVQAFGVRAYVGKLDVAGAMSIEAKATKENAYGVLLTGNVSAEFSGDTTITASSEKGTGYALYMDRICPEGGEDESSEGTPKLLLSGKTVLNGEVFVGADTTLTNTGELTVNGSLQSEGAIDISSGVLTANSINLKNNGSLTIGQDGTLLTTSNQVFTVGLGTDGSGADAGELKSGFIVNGKLSLTDSFYNLDYLGSASKLITTGGSVSFTGKLVDNDGGVLTEIPIESLPDNMVLEDVDVTVKGEDGGVAIDKNFGGKSLVVTDATAVSISNGNTVTLVGDNTSKELIDFGEAQGEKTLSIGPNATLALGSESGNQSGQITQASVTLDANSGLQVKGGTFLLSDLTVGNQASLNVGESGVLSLEKMTVTRDAEVTLTGTVQVEELTRSETGASTVLVGTMDNEDNPGAKGDLTVRNDSIAGFSFFLDPTWVDGKSVDDASRLVLKTKQIDGTIIVGQNSYVVMGTEDDTAFRKLFADGVLTWGNGENETLAAVYAAGPLDVTKGYLRVDQTLDSMPGDSTPAGSVIFAEKSVLVADVSELTSENTLLTGSAFTVDATSKAVIVGDIKSGITYHLTNDQTEGASYWNTEETLIAGNPLWNLSVEENGGFTATLTDAGVVYGDLMQGHAIANAGMASDNQGYRDYVNQLLTDTTGSGSLAHRAAVFDAAMNPAGALAVFTTAYDRASDLRRVVREETAVTTTGPRLWAQVTGGRTKLDGISTGAQSLDVETDAYGLVVGSESSYDSWKFGMAFTAGTGDTENDDVDAKDDFDFYGLSLYGKKTVGHYDFLFDASATWLKSDLTVGGVADIDADTTTTVWSFGGEVRRTAELGWTNLTPFVGANLYYVTSDDFSNGHGARVEESDATAVEFPIGAELSKAFRTAGGMGVRSAFSLAVVPTIGDSGIDSKVRFAGAQSTYNYTFTDDVKVRSNLSILGGTENFAFGAKVGYEWGDEERSATTFSFNASYRF